MQLALDFTSRAARRGEPPRGRARLEARIQRALGTRVELIITDNRRTMISTRRRKGETVVRMHRMFLGAPDAVVEELLSYLAEGDARASRALGRYIEANRANIQRPRRRILLRGQGRHHDLDLILKDVAKRYFANPELEGAKITWGRNPPRRKHRRSIRLGTYTHDQQLVRIHPALDQSEVPRFFVAFVVFHELLHHVVPALTEHGRINYHPPDFKRREQAHPDYKRAVKWETEHLDMLLAY